MAAPEFVEIASYANASEAEFVRVILEDSGVSAFVDGAAANTALSYIGTALGGVKVFVRAEDAQRAREVVANFDTPSEDPATPWFCGTCKETIDGTFQVCWSCGEARASVEQPMPGPGRDEHDNSGVGAATSRPSSHGDGTTSSPARLSEEIDQDAEAMVLRAWRASILGIVFLPVVMQLYSMYLLVRAALTTASLSPLGEKRFYRAFGVNLVAGCVWGVIIRFTLLALTP